MAVKATRWLKLFEQFLPLIRVRSREVVATDPRGSPLEMWESQRRFVQEVGQGLDNDIHVFRVLKSRQLGITTVSLAIDVFWLALHPGLIGCLVTDTEKNREADRNILIHYINSMPEGYFGDQFKIIGNNRSMLRFSNGARLDFLVAGTKNKGISWGEGIGYAFAHCCLAEGTPVITENGIIKPIEKVSVGDKVLTHTGKEATVVDVYGQINTKGPMLRIWPWLGSPIYCTEEHTIPTARGIVEARDVRKDDWLLMPVREIRHDMYLERLPETSKVAHSNTNREGWIRLLSVASGAVVELDEELGFAIGYYLAEGCIIVSHVGSFAGVTFARHRTETVYSDRAVAAIKKYTSGSVKTVDREDCLTTTVTVYGTAFASWLAVKFGRTAQKHIPDEVFGWGKPFCRGLLAGLLCGDGSKGVPTAKTTVRKLSGKVSARGVKIGRPATGPTDASKRYPLNFVVLPTTRSSIATQARDIAAALGYGWGSIRYEPAAEKHGRVCKEQWRVCWSGRAAFELRGLMGLPQIPMKGIRAENYEIGGGQVYIAIRSITPGFEETMMWDISVDHDDHTFRTPSVAVGNTEVANYGSVEGLKSLEEGFSTNNPDALYIYESTAKGFNHWRSSWLSGQADKFSQRSFFIGWWAGDHNIIKKSDPKFVQFGRAPASGEEREKTKQVEEQYGHKVNQEQLAWIRWKQSNAGAEKDLLEQNQPWCVVAGTRVGTSRGILKIEDVHSGDYTSMGKIQAAGESGRAEIWRVQTKMGYCVEGTGNHPLINVEGEEVEFEKSLGSQVRLMRPTFSDELYSATWMEGVIDLSVDITPDFARLAGLFMGDGSMSGSPRGGYHFSITCDSKDQDVIQECVRLVTSLFGVNVQVQVYREVGNGGWTSVRTSSRLIYDTFRKLGLAHTDNGFTQRRVHVPEFIWRSPKHVVKEFLRGLFEADGHSAKKQDFIVFASKHKKFVKDIQILLLGFGITCKTFSTLGKIRKNNNGRVYSSERMELRALESVKFFEEIGFLSERKIAVHRDRVYVNKKMSEVSRKPILFEDEVTKVEKTDRTETVYNVSIRGAFKWFDCNGVLTHNTAEEAFVLTGYSFFQPRVVTQDLQKIYDGVVLNISKGYRYEVDGGFYQFRMHALDPRVDPIENVELKVWEEPEPGGKYVIGMDPAYGRKEWKDFHAISVWRCFADKMVQVAEYEANDVEVKHAAWVLFHLAAAYRDCLINVEITGPGTHVMTEFDHLRQLLAAEMNKQATEEREWQDAASSARWYLYHRPDSIGAGYQFNFESNWRTKQDMLHGLRGSYMSGEIEIRSVRLLKEMSIVVVNDDDIGAPESKDENAKDDCVFALGLANKAWREWVRKDMIAQGLTWEVVMNDAAPDKTPQSKSLNHLVRGFLLSQAQAAEEARLAGPQPPLWKSEHGLA